MQQWMVRSYRMTHKSVIKSGSLSSKNSEKVPASGNFAGSRNLFLTTKLFESPFPDELENLLTPKTREVIQQLAELLTETNIPEETVLSESCCVLSMLRVFLQSEAVDRRHKELREECSEMLQLKNDLTLATAGLKAFSARKQEQQSQLAASITSNTEQTKFLKKKSSEYETKIRQLEKTLASRGYKPEISQEVLTKRSEEVQKISAELSELKARINQYHGLPPDIDKARQKLVQKTKELKKIKEQFEQRIQDELFRK